MQLIFNLSPGVLHNKFAISYNLLNIFLRKPNKAFKTQINYGGRSILSTYLSLLPLQFE